MVWEPRRTHPRLAILLNHFPHPQLNAVYVFGYGPPSWFEYHGNVQQHRTSTTAISGAKTPISFGGALEEVPFHPKPLSLLLLRSQLHFLDDERLNKIFAPSALWLDRLNEPFW